MRNAKRERICRFEELYEQGLDDLEAYELDEFDEEYYHAEFIRQWEQYLEEDIDE